jgi:phosphoglycerate dehydrogenase-like enzyme
MPKILIITPVHHISGVIQTLRDIGEINCMEDPTSEAVRDCISDYDAIFTNPNKSNVFLGKEIIDRGKRLKVICTASTGTNHIDKQYAADKNIKVLSLTEEREVINKISSTAEHAFALMLTSLRHIPQAYDSVKRGEWDYEPFIGRQLDQLTVGVVGYGRLGSLFANYSQAFGSTVLVYDPHKDVNDGGINQVGLEELLTKSDVISLHIHVTGETKGMVNEAWLSRMKRDVLLVNTSRGDICNEEDIISFLCDNPGAIYATDVLADEVLHKNTNSLREFAGQSDQILITPHIGGMTREGQMIAYNHAACLLSVFFKIV